MNNRQLYESIMKNVSKTVKRALMENEYNLDVKQAADILIDELKTRNNSYDFETELSGAIQMMRIISGNRKDRTYYKGVPYSVLIPELERRLEEIMDE